MSASSKLAYALAFQLGWLLCVLMGNAVGITYVFIFSSYYFWQKFKANQQYIAKELIWFFCITICGFIIESIFLSAGFLYIQVSPNYTQVSPNLFEQIRFAPAWLVCLWSLFSIALRTCMSFVFTRPFIAYLLCTLIIPVNYYAGAQLSPQVELHRPFVLSLGLITLTWIVFLAGLIHIKHHYFEGALHDH